ncbi:MAG: polysaccharide deacetylase family protein [Bryobacterales bacterium]|nr:polysaccharide deacetylase family protein [Bryobacterales bacterium]
MMRLGGLGPVVTFTFDDFPRTAYTVGGAILKECGAAGTFYTAFALMNSSNYAGEQFCLDDLHSLVADGHELASHTLHHVSSRTVSTPEFVEEVIRGRSAMQSVPGLVVSDNFAYPFGAVSASAKRAVGRAMRSCRSIYQGVNGPAVDLNLLRANPLYGGIERMSAVRDLVRRTEEQRGWLIFYTHDVQTRHSPYGCTPALLESAVTMAVESSMRILTVRDVVAQKEARGSSGEAQGG